MTEEELIERRLAGASYEELGRLAGLSESRVWKMLRGRVPGVRKVVSRLVTVRGSDRTLTAQKSPPGREVAPSTLGLALAHRRLLLAATRAAWEGVSRITGLRSPYQVSRSRHLTPAVIEELDARAAAVDAPRKFPGHWHAEKVRAGECLPCDQEAGRGVPDWFAKNPDWFKPKRFA